MSVEVWTKVPCSPHDSQGFQFRHSIILFMGLEGSTGICDRTMTSPFLLLREQCPQPGPRCIRFEDEIFFEVGKGQHRSVTEEVLQLFERLDTTGSPDKRSIFAS